MPSIDTLVDDIYRLFNEGHKVNEDNTKKLGEAISKAVARSLNRPLEEAKAGTLRMSNLGKKDCQLWYEVKGNEDPEELRPNERIKFLFGDILECLLIFLARESGHLVQDEQAPAVLEGIMGSMDCTIDGVVVDCKSASSRSFQKFKDGSLATDDPFGYVTQISAYATSKGQDQAAFLAIDKQLGHIALMKTLVQDNLKERIAHLKEVVSQDTPPARCFEPVPDGKSGNMKLPMECSYCKWKRPCWGDKLRVFLYSTGPRYLTTVVKLPDVPELPLNGVSDEDS